MWPRRLSHPSVSSALAFAKYAVVEWTKPDRYGRIIGKVTVDGQDVGLQQIEAGLAWWYRRYAREQSPVGQVTYARAEDGARIARVGLWQDSQALPPWEYRHPGIGVTKTGYHLPAAQFLEPQLGRVASGSARRRAIV